MSSAEVCRGAEVLCVLDGHTEAQSSGVPSAGPPVAACGGSPLVWAVCLVSHQEVIVFMFLVPVFL